MPHDMSRRFMNLLGSPNWTSPLLMCAGNTACVNRVTQGWHQISDYDNTRCIVLWGHDPQPKKWVGEYLGLKAATDSGAKLIVIDPFRSFNASRADLWLQVRPGTDAALALGWLNVIIEEGLYDARFVADWTVGFPELEARVKEFELGRVAEITGVRAETIRDAARLYATTKPAIIPWGCTLDMQTNSTNALRALGILARHHGQPRRARRRGPVRLPPPDPLVRGDGAQRAHACRSRSRSSSAQTASRS